MNKRNETIYLQGYDAALLIAQTEVSKIRPGGKKIPLINILKWEDATEEQKQDTNLLWIKSPLMGKYTYRKLTKEEKEEQHLNHVWRQEQIVLYLLEHFSWRYAAWYAQECKTAGININLNVPYCRNSAQCTFFCPFYSKGCTYKEDNDVNNL